MIVAAGLLVLVGLGLFVAGVLTGDTTLYWACVGACVVAAVLLFLARRRMSAPAASLPPAAPAASLPPAAPAASRPPAAASSSSSSSSSSPAAVAPEAADEPDPARESVRTGRHAGGSTAAASVPTTSGNGAAPVTGVGAAAPPPPSPAAVDAGDPPVEEVEVTDLLLVVDLKDEVLVVDEHPRYHVAGCRHLAGSATIPLPVDEARTDGFTPCGSCRPDGTLADRVRARKATGGA